ncbi:hypothetical protein [Roseicella aerolata]|uniref:Phasin protein n=1 Tax=Roseicella aerolata TaxID=2883479 RepID=A0A9X1I990_9PROT|nr:hypothetical protein [Roseicella aerolata]MCB4820564.1 hypothetical protein [Roseicella aerolata]
MTALPDTPAATEPGLPTADASPGAPLAGLAAAWIRPLDLWTGQWADRAGPLPAAARDAAEGILLIQRAMLEANQVAAAALRAAALRQQDAIRSAALRQQDLAFATARVALSTLDGAAAWAAPQRALALCGEALGAAQSLGAAAFGMPAAVPALAKSGAKPRQ